MHPGIMGFDLKEGFSVKFYDKGLAGMGSRYIGISHLKTFQYLVEVPILSGFLLQEVKNKGDIMIRPYMVERKGALLHAGGCKDRRLAGGIQYGFTKHRGLVFNAIAQYLTKKDATVCRLQGRYTGLNGKNNTTFSGPG
jgi:hypothetical protein